MPLTLGHENAGRVAAVGAGVRTVKEGDPVAVYGGWGCGICDYCITGHEQLCETPRWVGLSDTTADTPSTFSFRTSDISSGSRV